MSDMIEAAASLPPPLPPLPDTSSWPVCFIFLADDGTLAFKPKDVKGARWRGGFKTMGKLADAADAVMGEGPRLIDFVESRI